MALVFHRRLAVPLWALAFFAVALTVPPPATLSLIAAVAIAVTTRGLVHALSPRRHQGSAAISIAAGTCVRTLDEPNRDIDQDALDLVRMDDDGGWQMARPTS